MNLELTEHRGEESTLMYSVNRGLAGENYGLGNGMGKRLNRLLFGTHRARYYLIGADSGVGKTTLTDYMFLYNLYYACKEAGIELALDYYSWEISLINKKAKLAALIYWNKYREILTTEVILGLTDGTKLSARDRVRLELVSKEVEEIFGAINFVGTPQTPYQMQTRLLNKAVKYGDVIKDTQQKGLSAYVGYTRKRHDVFQMSIIDHLALAEVPDRMTLKGAMDKISTSAVFCRDLFGESFAIVQQFNTEMQSAARERKSTMAYVPSRQDFGDSKYSFRDADTVIGLTRPKDFELDKFGSYERLAEWGHYFQLLFVMKNRYGNIGTVPLFHNLLVGQSEELPSGNDWNALLQERYIDLAHKLDNYAYNPASSENSTNSA